MWFLESCWLSCTIITASLTPTSIRSSPFFGLHDSRLFLLIKGRRQLLVLVSRKFLKKSFFLYWFSGWCNNWNCGNSPLFILPYLNGRKARTLYMVCHVDCCELCHQMRFRAHMGQILLNKVIYPIKKSKLGQCILAVRPAPDGIVFLFHYSFQTLFRLKHQSILLERPCKLRDIS